MRPAPQPLVKPTSSEGLMPAAMTLLKNAEPTGRLRLTKIGALFCFGVAGGLMLMSIAMPELLADLPVLRNVSAPGHLPR